jgi:hypothetical protein
VSRFRKVSVLVPTRRRLSSLAKLLTSFDATVCEPAHAQLIFRCDSDDPDTIEVLRHTPHTFIVGPRCAGYKSLPGFFNDMAAIAGGDLLMCCNDDAEFRTPGWPGLLLEEANRYPDGVFNIGVTVGLNDDKFPFSVVSRRLYEALGFLNDPRLLFSDVFLLDVARAFDRAIRLESVSVFHDWAGHRADDTRRDANRDEFDVVFADDAGNWTDAYRTLHEQVVAEAVRKIRDSALLMPDMIVNSLESYRPAERDAGAPWPPTVACRGWNGSTAPDAIHYSKIDVREVLRVMLEQRITDGEVLLSSFNNGLPSRLWGQLFDRVFTICDGPASATPWADEKQTICYGSPADAKFLGGLAKRLRALRAMVLDDGYYASLISPYFLLRRVLQRPAIVVFTNTGPAQDASQGARRFVGDLRRGSLDNQCHQIVDVHLDPQGSGMSYELLL